MKELKREDIIAVLRAVDEDWSVIDRTDKEDFMVLINASRNEKEGFRPKKNLIKEIENLGYISKFEDSYRGMPILQKPGEEYTEWEEIPDSAWTIHFYEVTTKGKDLLATH